MVNVISILTALLTLTAAIQSSGAVTVMVIGFVNVGIMSLTQAGTEYISLAQNSERVADHLINVAKTIRDLQ